MLFEPDNTTQSNVDSKTKKEEEQVYKCSACGTEITKDKFLCSVNSDSPFQSFMNPNGFYFDLITFSDCESVIDLPAATFEHTWFPGYAWRILGCAKCSQHLGWSFEAANKTPSQFYGLIRDKLSCG